MTTVKILLAPSSTRRNLSFIDDLHHAVRARILEILGEYKQAGSFKTDLSGEDAAEEAFDLTNNPGRQDEREEKYGRGQSVSTGDVINVDGENFLCMSSGWEKL